MIKTETVFILGAGASMFYGLPSGRDLVSGILRLDRSGEEVSMLCQCGIDPREFSRFQDELKKSQQDSIDAFLEHRTDFMPIDKAAIALQLLPCEKQDSLSVPSRVGEESWYRMLLNKAMDCGSVEEFASNKVAFVTFNYDRSLEQFFHTTLANRYRCSLDQVEASVQKIPIIHVHGRLGRLPWQAIDANAPIDYGAETTPDAIKSAADSIKVISEFNNADNSPEFQEARRVIASAELIYFLGFGYHPDNISRLRIPFCDNMGNWPDPIQRTIRGTCFGASNTQIAVWQERYHGLRLDDDSRHKIDGFLKCDKVFLEHER